MESLKQQLSKVEKRVKSLAEKLNLNEIKTELRKLESKSLKTDFWKDEAEAKRVMREIANAQEVLISFTNVEEKTIELKKLIDLASREKEHDQELVKDLQKSLFQIDNELKSLELKTFFSGTHDKQDAIVSIHSGQGGTEAMDWAAMLFRMYTRFFERKKWEFEVLQETAGEEAGIKSATILVKANNAYGSLKGETGTHRLVRQSPFNADKLRQTSFALVEVLPRISQPKDAGLKEEDVEFHSFRSSGHGGQNVNKVSTAVRLKHLPTGIVVECQTQRKQEQNRKIAMELLTAKLWEKKQREHQEKMKSIKGDHKIAGWGNQIRSYVLHPYHLVKDLRTRVETQQTNEVLDGNLDEFIEAQVRQL